MSQAPLVHVVEDDGAVRDALCVLLRQHGLQVREYGDAAAFLAAVGRADRGCAILDLRMPGMDGLELQQEMKRRGLLLVPLILTGHGTIPASVQAIKAGAVNFLSKPVPGSVLLESVRAALAESEQAHALAQADLSAASRVAALTGREREVMQLLLQGLANKEIGKRLQISHRTVEIHKARVLHKAGVESVVELLQAVAAGRAVG